MTLGGGAKLEVLKFTRDDFSFHWTKEGSTELIEVTSKPNVLTFQSMCEEDLGYYRCEVKEAGRVVLTYCLQSSLQRHLRCYSIRYVIFGIDYKQYFLSDSLLTPMCLCTVATEQFSCLYIFISSNLSVTE